jgi:hypothetical protein
MAFSFERKLVVHRLPVPTWDIRVRRRNPSPAEKKMKNHEKYFLTKENCYHRFQLEFIFTHEWVTRPRMALTTAERGCWFRAA